MNSVESPHAAAVVLTIYLLHSYMPFCLSGHKLLQQLFMMLPPCKRDHNPRVTTLDKNKNDPDNTPNVRCVNANYIELMSM
jgi:hypothetical protein